jgi:hypothetical protein
MFLKKPENIYAEPEISIKDLSMSDMLQRARSQSQGSVLSVPSEIIDLAPEEKVFELAEEIEEEPILEPTSDPPDIQDKQEIHPTFETLLNKLTHEERVLLFDELHGKKGAFEEAFPPKLSEDIPDHVEIPQEVIPPQEDPVINDIKDETPAEDSLIEDVQKENSEASGLDSIQGNLGIDTNAPPTILGVTMEESEKDKDEEPKSKDWYNRPEGWNKGSSGSWSSPIKPLVTKPKPKPYKPRKKSLLKIWWMVITDKDGLEPKEFGRYESVVTGTIKPAFFSIVIAFIVLLCIVKGGITSTSAENYKDDDIGPLDKFINWVVKKYDNVTGKKDKNVINMTSVTKTDSIISLQPDSTGYLIPSDIPVDQSIELNPDTFYEPVHKKIVLHDTFHYYRTDTIIKKVIIVDTQLGKLSGSLIPKKNHLDSILHKNR